MRKLIESLADIHLFVEVARTGSFSRAGVRLGMPVPTVSRRIAAMERRLEVQLFQRTTRKVVLTPVARTFYERCLDVAEAAAAAQAAIEKSRAMQERIRIAMPVDLGVDIIGPIIGRFLAGHPGLSVDFDLSSDMADLFRDPIDLAFRIGKVNDDRVVARRIATIASGVYASPDCLERNGPINSPVQLEHAPCLKLQTSTGSIPWVVGSHRWESAPGRCAISANSVSLLRSLAEEGHGIALLPRHLVRESIHARKLVALLESEKTPSWPLFAVTATRLISKGMRQMITHVANELSAFHDQIL